MSMTGGDCGGGEWGVVVRVSLNGELNPWGRALTRGSGAWSGIRDERFGREDNGAFQLLDGAWVRMWQDGDR